MMPQLRLGINIAGLNLKPRAAFQEAARLGVTGVQVDGVGDFSPDTLSATGRREVLHLLRSNNLELTALHLPLRRGLDMPAQLDQRLDYLRRVMQLAYDLGPRLVIVPAPRVPSDDPEDPRRDLLRDVLTGLGRYADRVGVRLALETGFDSGEKLSSYLATFDVGGLAVNYDTGNMQVNGHDPLTNLPPLAPYLAHIHARDIGLASPSRGAEEVPLGGGTLDWFAFAAVLAALEYRGWTVVDRELGNDKLADMAKGIAVLRRIAG